MRFAVHFTEGGNLLVRPDGTGDAVSGDGQGFPIMIEIDDDGKPTLLVWADIGQHDPTHTIDLSGALESRRL